MMSFEQFLEKNKQTMKYIAVAIAVILGLLIYVFLADKTTYRNSSFALKYRDLLWLGLLSQLVRSLIERWRIHSDPVAAKEKYIEATDERMVFVHQVANSQAIMFMMGLLGLGFSIATFYNQVVALTLLICLFVLYTLQKLLIMHYEFVYSDDRLPEAIDEDE